MQAYRVLTHQEQKFRFRVIVEEVRRGLKDHFKFSPALKPSL
jgi:hypothetical protein